MSLPHSTLKLRLRLRLREFFDPVFIFLFVISSLRLFYSRL
ncbi:hypothetical protein CCACVL1_29076 [Corchorus capsularis]|uniref:Uncharacterized protein n=1 Tax=Corchorus capsularis TaxID=210143 RepID=A0A1R3G404_COCAP|nr:hypothetical protein CCACVL1_29076 [Corchorus capsularis]